MASFKNRMASQHSFAMVPRSDIPRSRYMLQQNRRQTFNGGDLIPIYCEEILPGDHFRGESHIFARLATPITPVLDNAELETFFFFVPNRICWENWEAFISGGNYLVPQIGSPGDGFVALSIYDQFGLPGVGQVTPGQVTFVNALPLRAYNRIYNEWFRDQNLSPALAENMGDGPDSQTDYGIRKRSKKHDYFTSSLPWPQKGTAVSLPLGTSAPVVTNSTVPIFNNNIGEARALRSTVGTGIDVTPAWTAASSLTFGANSGLIADLSTATAATINAFRLAFSVQELLEKDARGGTRYIEQLQSHFGVRPPDFRLQRPEYIGGGRTMVNTHPIAQTSESNETPQGNLAAFSTASGGAHRFSYAATEHGYIIGIVNVRTDLTYQQGTRRHWTRRTRYDYYWPTFAHLGEQAVLKQEIFTTGIVAQDEVVFGYQERSAEYRYTPNEVTGLFRSTHPNTIDVWHYGEEFATTPSLNNAFIIDPSATVLARSMAVHGEADGQQILLDVLHRVVATRPMPTYSVPGLGVHF